MKPSTTSEMSLRLELFVTDLEASLHFYTRVLKFTAGERSPDGYLPLRNGEARLALNQRSTLTATHPLHYSDEQSPGLGVEIVLEVEDLTALYAHVQAQAWPIASPLQRQAWGQVDFRLVDPDGYYLRLTGRGR